MGQVSHIKIIILIICFVLTGILIYVQPSSKVITKKVLLSQTLSDINGWKIDGVIPLDQRVVNMLQLDDYVNQYYSKGNKTVSLYVGYYLTTEKLGVVHDPLVCFPGQGWIISKAEKKTLRIRGDNVHLTSMIVTKGQQKELTLYWFQAFDKTSPNTFLQKIYSLLVKYLNGREDNAFVRVTIQMNKQSIKEASNIGVKFIEDFFPLFLKYVRENSELNK